MKLKYLLTEKDYVDYNIDHMYNSPSIRKSLFVQRYIIPVLFLLIPFCVDGLFSISWRYWMIWFAIVFIQWIIFFPGLVRRTSRKRIGKMLREGINTDFLGERTLDLQEDAIYERGISSESKKSWDAVEKVIEGKKHIYIYVSAITAFIVPLTAFADDDEKNQFLSMINRKTEKTARK